MAFFLFGVFVSPPVCTSLIQALDVSVGQNFKDYLKEVMEDELHCLVRLEGKEILAKLDRGKEESIGGAISAIGLCRLVGHQRYFASFL